RATPGRVIHKAFKSALWLERDSGKQYGLQTVILNEEMLDDPESLTLSPSIFQEFVPKASELRVTIFGRTCIAAQITDQDEVDYRPTHKMTLKPFVPPAEIERQVLAFMDEMKLVMGTLDLIVTPEGKHVFLEVNEQGQFLWK